jgi:hypothetical protein
MPVMKAAEPGTGNHACRRRAPAFHLPWCRCVLAKGIVNPVVVVVVDIVAQQPPQISFVRRDDVVQDLPPTASDPALRNPVLPGRLKLVRFGVRPVAFTKVITSASNIES